MMSLNSIRDFWKEPHARVNRDLREARQQQHVSFRPPLTPSPSSTPPESGDPNVYVEPHSLQFGHPRDAERLA